MKIIEAMKKVKENKQKIVDLKEKMLVSCSNLSYETPVYGLETKAKIKEWAQSCCDLSQNNIELLCKIQNANSKTTVTIELGGKNVTKTISEWIWRRREYAASDLAVWKCMNDRGLKESNVATSTGAHMEVKIVRHFDPLERDRMIDMYASEAIRIDSALEVVNATTDLG